MKIIIVVLALLAPLASKPTIKATTDDGRRVLLNPDGTWEYVKDSTPAKPKASSAPAGNMAKARAYRGPDGTYHVSSDGDGEASYQVGRINEDIIALVPMCADADEAFMKSIRSSLDLDAYQLSQLIGPAEAEAFRKNVAAKGCL